MRSIKAFIFALLSTASICPSTISADEFSDGILTITDRSVSSRKYYNRTDITKIIFPADISGILSFAFYGCSNLKEVIFTGNIPFFNEGAFYNCNNIERVEIQPENFASWCSRSTDYSWDRPYGTDLYIGPTKVTDLEIPESVSSIGFYAFYGFRNIQSVHWPGHSVSVGDGGLPFSTLKSIYCNSITDWVGSSFQNRPFYPNTEFFINGQKCPSALAIPEGVARIGAGCFCGNADIVELEIPESVRDMGYDAFRNCENLKKLTIKARSVGYQDNLFAGCTSLEEVILDCGGIIGGGENFLTDSPIQVFRFNNSAFSLDAEVRTSSTKEVYTNNLAMWCENMSVLNSKSKLYINDAIPTSVEIPDGVSNIADLAFIGQPYDTIVIPASVKSIGNYSLSDVKFIVCRASTPPTITSSTFSNVNKSECRIIVPDGSLQQYINADYWSEFENITSDKTTDLNHIVVGEKPATVVKVYNSHGQQLTKTLADSNCNINNKLSRGVYIIVTGEESHKVIIQ